MTNTTFRSALFLATASWAIAAVPAHADTGLDADADREYLPSDILVTGDRSAYSVNDGSTATKTPTPLIDVPQTVTILTKDQLQDQSIRQLGDALRYVPGISLETGEGHRDEIFIRGQETTADFYLDGLRDDAQYYRSLYNVERIEILKGANALIFGRGGGGGVINRVSKTANFAGPSVTGDASIDTFGSFALSADANQPLSDTIAVRINGTYEEFDNHRDFFEGRFIGFAPTVTAQLGPDTRLTAHYSYDDDRRVTDRGVPSLDGQPLFGFDETFFGDPDFNEARAKVHIARTRIDHRFSDSFSANASLQYANYDKIYANILPRGIDDDGDVEFSGYQDFTQRENFIGQANFIYEGSTGALDHTLLFGVEASRQDTQNGRSNAQFATDDGFEARTELPLAEIFDLPPISLTAPVRSRDSQLDTLSAYIQDQVAIGDYIQVIGGVRFDRFDLDTVDLLSGVPGSRVDEKFSPRAGLVVKPNPDISLYASYAESFLPQAGDQFLLLSPTSAAFAPEKFTNYELGAKWAARPGLLFTAALFRLDRTNTRASDPNNSGLTVLTGSSRTEGVELNLVGDILPGWEANIGYTYLDGEITSDSNFADAGTRLQQVPEHQFAAWNHFDITERFGLGLGAIYRDEQFASFSNDVVLPDYFRVDAAAFYEVSEKLSLQVNIENLFDEEYYPSAHGDNNIQPAEPFSVRFGIRVGL